MLNHMLEAARWLGVFCAIYFSQAYGADGPGQFTIYAVITVCSLAGLTGLESVFLGEKAAEQSGYGGGGGYQRQSGLNNLALTAVTLWAWLRGWSLESLLALFMVLMVFLSLSAANHAYSALREGNTSRRNFLRPAAVVILWGASLPYLIGIWGLS